MPDPWVAVDATVRRNAKLAALPNDSARWGWMVMLGEAKLLRQHGTFSPSQWPESMGRFAKFLAHYLEHGLLHRSPVYCDEPSRCLRGRGPFLDGRLVVHDWPVHQREHAVRQVTYRETHPKGASDVESDVSSDTPSRALSRVPVEGRLSGSPGEGSGERVLALFEELTQVPYAIPPHSKNADRIARWVAKDGWEKVEATAREAAADLGGYPEVNQLCNTLDNYLHPPAGSKVVSLHRSDANPEDVASAFNS